MLPQSLAHKPRQAKGARQVMDGVHLPLPIHPSRLSYSAFSCGTVPVAIHNMVNTLPDNQIILGYYDVWRLDANHIKNVIFPL